PACRPAGAPRRPRARTRPARPAPARGRRPARRRRWRRTSSPTRRPCRPPRPRGRPSPASPCARTPLARRAKSRGVRERTVSRMDDRPGLDREPVPGLDRRTLRDEVVVVLMLSFLGSAVYAIIDLLSAPVAGVYVAAADQSSLLAKQIAGVVFGLAPVLLVLHLVRPSGEGRRWIRLVGD